MGVSSTANRISYIGDGTTTNPTFSFPYYFFKTTDLLVYLYDTILGGVTPLNIGTDYSVSGTANFQGLFPNGGNVQYLDGIIPTTSYLIIIRNPPETQTFNILENGIIPSQTLIQQLDYLTLLIQRLEDQVSLAVAVPDGLGLLFNPALPSTMIQNPNGYLQVNGTGNGWVLNQNLNLAGWNSVTIPYSSFSAAALVAQTPAFVLPASSILTGLVIKHSIAFSGSGITDVYVQAGISTAYDLFVDYFDVFQSVADQAFINAGLNYIGSWANTTQIYLQAKSVGANLSSLTKGSVTVYYQTQFI